MPLYTGSGFTDLLLAIAHLVTSGSSTSITQPPATTTA
ncbi:hypothetical protein NS506_07827 [Nocardia seriolae]|uniref:Uncharacterized protein n=1 Tax=Nocardia seriolae TaxID=37332 RepID=A0ABC8B5L4_9NOCA|nr:hypothetical protein NS506_07827 [Nocardia seriolae]BAW04000.1 hypothetical protein NSERUTF1_0758 [Nocardia seriolae]